MEMILDARHDAAFEIGARLDALLCYPKWALERQTRIANAICANLMRGWIALEPERAEELRPNYLDYKRAAARTSIEGLEERRRKALVAGQSFLPLIKEAATGILPVLEGESGRLTRHRIAEFLWPPREGGFEIDYVERLGGGKQHRAASTGENP